MAPALKDKRKATFLGLLVVLLTASLLYYTKEIHSRLSNAGNAWNHYHTQTIAANEALALLQFHAGYGGYFFNALRHYQSNDPSLLPVLDNQERQLRQAIDRYRQLASTKDELNALNRLQTLIDDIKLRLRSDQPHPSYDTEAISALSTLINASLSRNETGKQQTMLMSKQGLDLMLWGMILIPAITVIAAIFITFMAQTLTRKKRAVANKRHLDAVIEASPDAMIMVTPEGLIAHCNRKAEDLFNQKRAELVHTPLQALIELPLDFAHAAERYTDKLSETRILADDARRIPVEIAFSQTQIDTEDILIFAIRDVSERIRHEQHLRQASIVFNGTKDGILITDEKKRIIAANQAFTELSGYAEHEALGKALNFHKYNDPTTSSQRKISSALKRRDHWQGEMWNRRKNNEIYPVWENISCVKSDQGEITNYISVFSDISAIKESEQRLNHLAHHDILTGLPNRLLFSVNLTQTLERAKRHKYRVGLLFIDLDRFKIINDTMGHAAGDLFLEKIAQRLIACVRAEDTVCRLGGDEFTVILSQINQAEDAAILAKKINQTLSQPLNLEKHEVITSASIGISVFPDDSSNGEDLARAADTAMYRAKENGRNTYQFYSADLTDKALQHLTLEQGLRQAIAREEFFLHYQPQFCLKQNCFVGVEALIRWRHPQLGLIYPDRFIPLAEETGLIEAIGEWVLHSVCQQIKSWREQGLPTFRVSINVSAREIMNRNTLNKFKHVIENAGIDANHLHLELEITEGALQDVEQGTSVLTELKSLGVSLAIDDFGTGYSSLSRLKHLPIDTLKIDRSFVKDLPLNKDDGAIASAVIALGQSLNLRVVAEGAETTEQIRFLKEQGCDEVQGFLLGRPMLPNEIPPIIYTTPVNLALH